MALSKKRPQIDHRIQKGLNAEYTQASSSIIRETINQLEEYSRGERTEFEMDITLVGTDFQKSVWTELQNIGFGKTLSYLELAENLSKGKAVRAVAAANGANAISIIVPCHRIIGSTGQLVGYAGGLATKKKLLKNENVFNSQMDLFS